MTLTSEGIDLIKRFEGFRSEPYKDAADVLTIGYGHVILPDERFTSITEAEAEHLLRNDLQRFCLYVPHFVKVPLNDNQFSALVSLCFNAGVAPLTHTLGQFLNQGDYAAAADEFGRWVYAGGEKLDGLAKRREAEKELFLKPT